MTPLLVHRQAQLLTALLGCSISNVSSALACSLAKVSNSAQ